VEAQVLAAAILRALGREPIELDPQMLHLVHAKQQLLHASWLSHVGHKRPGVAAGLPLEEARAKSSEIDLEIAKLK
jgi:hypothetical protein